MDKMCLVKHYSSKIYTVIFARILKIKLDKFGERSHTLSVKASYITAMKLRAEKEAWLAAQNKTYQATDSDLPANMWPEPEASERYLAEVFIPRRNQ